MIYYLYLAGAIILEVLATNLMKASEGFTKLPYTLGTMGVYGLCFFLLALAVKGMDLSLAYAIWAGVGIILTTAISVLVWHESINLATALGLALIVIGVVIVNLFSSAH